MSFMQSLDENKDEDWGTKERKRKHGGLIE